MRIYIKNLFPKIMKHFENKNICEDVCEIEYNKSWYFQKIDTE